MRRYARLTLGHRQVIENMSPGWSRPSRYRPGDRCPPELITRCAASTSCPVVNFLRPADMTTFLRLARRPMKSDVYIHRGSF